MFSYFYLGYVAEKRRWSRERRYERGQGIRMSQDYGRFRNGKGRLRQKGAGRGDTREGRE
jgi:hypothetical protein